MGGWSDRAGVRGVATLPVGTVFSGSPEHGGMSVWNQLAEVEPTTLIVVGFVLVVFPEPATSAAGAGVMLLGIAWWISTWR